MPLLSLHQYKKISQAYMHQSGKFAANSIRLVVFEKKVSVKDPEMSEMISSR